MIDRVSSLRYNDKDIDIYYTSMQRKKKFTQTTTLLGLISVAVTIPYIVITEYDNEFVQNACLVYAGLIGFLTTQYPRIIAERFDEEILETAKILEYKLDLDED
jgi:hypothetical protein